MKKLLALILAAAVTMAAMICGAGADGEWKDFNCTEEQFTTKVPAAAVSRYETDNGLVVYTEHAGYIPNLSVHRRTGENKFKNPTNYLNNVYREYLEDKYGDNSRGMNPARTWEVGGKELLGARYMYMIGEYSVVQQVMIEVRDAGDVEYIVKYIDGQGDAILAVLEEAVRNYRETDVAASEPEPQPAAGGVLAPVDVSNTLVDNQNGTYWARVTDTDKIMSGGYFTVELYVLDLYAADQVWALQAGDKVQVNGKIYTVKSLQPEQDGRRELYVEEDIPGYIAFSKTSNTACVAVVDDWVPCTKVGEEKIMMPLANDFNYTWLDQDGNIGGTYNADEFVSMVTNDGAPVLNQYNTMIRFENGLLMMIGHQDYPYGPEETETAAPAETGMVDNSAPPFMIPSYFTARYNAMMEALADNYADALGEEGVQIINQYYMLTDTEMNGTTLDCINPDKNIIGRFFYPDEASVSENAPAMMMNLIVKSDVPEDVLNYFVKYGFKMMIAYDFQNEVSLDELNEWFDSAEDPDNVFSIPGYTLNVIKTDDLVLYAVIPPASQLPQLQN